MSIAHQKFMYQGENVPTADMVKILGAKLIKSGNVILYKYLPSDFSNVEATCNRICGCDLLFWARAGLVGGLVLSRINHASEVMAMSAENERSLRAATVTAFWQKVGRHRNPGVIFTVLTKGHITNVSQAIPTSRVLKFARGGSCGS